MLLISASLKNCLTVLIHRRTGFGCRGEYFFHGSAKWQDNEWSISDELVTFSSQADAQMASFDNKGILWACADEKNELWQIDHSKKVTPVPLKYARICLTGLMIFGSPQMAAYILQIHTIRDPGGLINQCLRTPGSLLSCSRPQNSDQVIEDLVQQTGL